MGVLTGQPLEPVRPMSHGAARTPLLIACSHGQRLRAAGGAVNRGGMR